MCACAAVSAKPKSTILSAKSNNISEKENTYTTTTATESTDSNDGESANKYSTKVQSTTSLLVRYRSVIQNRRFLLFALSMMMTSASMSSLMIYIIDYYETKGINRSSSVMLYAVMNLTGVFFRLIMGAITQIQCIPKLALPGVFMWLISLTFLLFPSAEGLAYFIVLACLAGIARGVLTSSMPILTFHLIGQDNYSTAFGLIMTLMGISSTIAGPIPGKYFCYLIL